MENQNITLSFPRDFLKKAKVYAAEHDVSLSGLIRQALKNVMDNKVEYKKAKSRQLKQLKKGFDFGTHGKIGLSRDELYARR